MSVACRDALTGLNYLHSQKRSIIHRDIKCASFIYYIYKYAGSYNIHVYEDIQINIYILWDDPSLKCRVNPLKWRRSSAFADASSQPRCASFIYIIYTPMLDRITLMYIKIDIYTYIYLLRDDPPLKWRRSSAFADTSSQPMCASFIYYICKYAGSYTIHVYNDIRINIDMAMSAACRDALTGLNYLHSQKRSIIHRDIKCASFIYYVYTYAGSYNIDVYTDIHIHIYLLRDDPPLTWRRISACDASSQLRCASFIYIIYTRMLDRITFMYIQMYIYTYICWEMTHLWSGEQARRLRMRRRNWGAPLIYIIYTRMLDRITFMYIQIHIYTYICWDMTHLWSGEEARWMCRRNRGAPLIYIIFTRMLDRIPFIEIKKSLPAWTISTRRSGPSSTETSRVPPVYIIYTRMLDRIPFMYIKIYI